MPGSSSTNAPKSVTRVTLPRTRSPAVYFSLQQRPTDAAETASCRAKCAASQSSIFSTFASISCPTVRDIGRIVDAPPRDIGHVQQTIDATDIDERSVIRQAANGARAQYRLR